MTLRKVFYNKAASKYFSMVLMSKNFTLMHLHNHDPNPISRNDYLHFAHEAMEPWGEFWKEQSWFLGELALQPTSSDYIGIFFIK